MISDDTFSNDLDIALRKQGFLINERKEIIKNYLLDGTIDRDLALDAEERKARLADSDKKKAKAVPLESVEPKNLVGEFRAKYTGVVIFCVRNDGSRKWQEKAEQVLMGVHKGVSDLFIPAFRIFLEMKRLKGKDSPQSKEQKEFERYVTSVGYHYILGYGCDDALEKIEKVIKNE